jgi:hypothetical protein
MQTRGITKRKVSSFLQCSPDQEEPKADFEDQKLLRPYARRRRHGNYTNIIQALRNQADDDDDEIVVNHRIKSSKVEDIDESQRSQQLILPSQISLPPTPASQPPETKVWLAYFQDKTLSSRTERFQCCATRADAQTWLQIQYRMTAILWSNEDPLEEKFLPENVDEMNLSTSEITEWTFNINREQILSGARAWVLMRRVYGEGGCVSNVALFNYDEEQAFKEYYTFIIQLHESQNIDDVVCDGDCLGAIKDVNKNDARDVIIKYKCCMRKNCEKEREQNPKATLTSYELITIYL